MVAPDITGDARRVFEVLKAGGIAICPSDVGYALFTVSPKPLEKIFITKKRKPEKRHPMMGTYEFHKELQIVESLQAEIVKTLVCDFRLPLAVAKYRPDHPLIKNFSEEQLEASTAKETICISIEPGNLCTEIAKLCHEANLSLQGSSANLTGTGNRFRVQDIPEELLALADLVIDYGLCKYSFYGRGQTLLDFSGAEIKVVRIGACYDVIKDLTKRFWGIELPSDPGRVALPSGTLKSLPPSESLARLVNSVGAI